VLDRTGMYPNSVAGIGTPWTKADARGFVRPSLWRALSDTVTYHWLRTVMAVATAVVAALIAFIVTGSHASWFAVFAAPAVLVPTYLIMFFLNLGGWNRRWKTSALVHPDGLHLSLQLEPKDGIVRFSGPEVDCSVRSPTGETFRHVSPGAHSIKGKYFAQYPEQFAQAPPLTPGRYRVTWVEETSPGKWREILTHRVTR